MSPFVERQFDERKLVGQILRGSTEHADLLVDAYFSKIYRFAEKRLVDSRVIEEVTEEVFLRVFASLPYFLCANVPLTVWIFQITRNAVNFRFARSGSSVPRVDGSASAPAKRPPAFSDCMVFWGLLGGWLSLLVLLLEPFRG